MYETEFPGIRFEDLEELRPLLSEASYRNLKKNMKLHRESSSPMSGHGVYDRQYYPRNRPEYETQNGLLKDHIKWIRTGYILASLLNEPLSRENHRLRNENTTLRDKNKELVKENERLKLQIKNLLGIKNSEKPIAGENPKAAVKIKSSKKRGAPKGHPGSTRRVPQHVDEVQTIPPPPVCPRCGNRHIRPGKTYVSKYIEDIPSVSKWVLEKRYLQGKCEMCHSTFTHPAAQLGPPVKLGPNITVLLTVMRQQLGATYRKMSRFCTETLGIPLTPSGVMGILSRMCRRLEPAYQGIEAALPAQKVLHGDETGWKMDGARWYIWCFCNRRLIFYHPSPSRGSQVVKDFLGADFGGILVADFYAAYNFISRTQRCLVHFLRDIRNELEISPDDDALYRLKSGIKSIIKEGLQIKALPPSSQRQDKRQKIEYQLDELSQLESTNHKTKTFVKRLVKFREHLVRFIDNPEVEYHNNFAERTIRPAVIIRKTTFGNRSPAGARDFALLNSVIETCRQNKKPVTQFLHKALETEQEKMIQLTRALIDTS